MASYPNPPRVCRDCGETYIANGARSTRCPDCYPAYRRAYKRKNSRKYALRNKDPNPAPKTNQQCEYCPLIFNCRILVLSRKTDPYCFSASPLHSVYVELAVNG
jgi:hypothetical protein